MTKLKPGDRVDVHINLYAIVGPYDPDYNEVKTFEVVAADRSGYYVYIPCYVMIKGSIAADSHLCKQLGIDKKFLNEQIIFIEERMINKINYIMDGCLCIKCQDFHYQALPNQENGEFICWSCRDNLYR